MGIWILVGLILGAILLNILHRPSVEFSLNAQVEAFSFRTPERVTTGPLLISLAQLQSADTVVTGNLRLATQPGDPLTLTGSANALTLSMIEIPKNWRVSLEASDKKHLILDASPPEISTAPDVAIMRFVSGEDAKLDYTSSESGKAAFVPLADGTPILITASSVSLELTTESAKLFGYSSISDLSLARDNKTVDDTGHQIVNVEGTVLEGTLWREHISDTEARLGPIDMLVVHDIRNGLLRNVTWRDGVLTVAAHGDAHQLQNVIGSDIKDLRPVWLDVLLDLGLLKVVFGAVTFIGGLEMSAFVRSKK